jgi:hypothetical protein
MTKRPYFKKPPDQCALLPCPSDQRCVPTRFRAYSAGLAPACPAMQTLAPSHRSDCMLRTHCMPPFHASASQALHQGWPQQLKAAPTALANPALADFAPGVSTGPRHDLGTPGCSTAAAVCIAQPIYESYTLINLAAEGGARNAPPCARRRAAAAAAARTAIVHAGGGCAALVGLIACVRCTALHPCHARASAPAPPQQPPPQLTPP